jgi:hypothetical protein
MLDRRHAIAIASAVVATALAACGPSPAVSAPAPSVAPTRSAPGTSPSSAPATPNVVSPAPSPSPSQLAATGCETNAPSHHDAPDLEATLPAAVAGRPLARWSVAGRCLLDLSFGGGAVSPDEFLRQADTLDPNHTIDPADLRYAVAGRSDVDADPPYFVFGASRPSSDEEIQVTMLLLFAGAGFGDPLGAADLGRYERRTIHSRTVYVGTVEMLAQTEHSRGRPYLYQTDDAMYLVVTDSDDWADQAIAALP